MLALRSDNELNTRVASGLDKVQAGVHAVVDNLPTVHAVFLLQTRIKARFDVLDNQLPAKITTQAKIDSEIRHSYLSSLLTKSPT